MSLADAASVAECSFLYIKSLSGRQIEEARKRKRITQTQLARELGMGVRWLREIESGNPKSKIDDHLICAYRLDLATGHIVIPLMFAGQKMLFPRQLVTGDLSKLERLCIELIAQRNLDDLTAALTPDWRVKPHGLGEEG